MPVKSLQCFAGKALSFSLAIPACKLYVREVFKAISTVPIWGPVRQELQGWAFLDNWSGHLPWQSEHDLSVTLFTDASQKAWGAFLVRDGASQEIHDYWLDHERDINVLEARVLYNTRSPFFPSIRNAQIDVWMDKVTLQVAWENSGCRNSLVNQEVKRVEEMSHAGNFALQLKYVPSTENVADAPPMLCLTLTVLCPWLCGHEFNRDSAHTHLILSLWTATVEEAGMEISCLTTCLGLPLILQEQMSSHS